MDFGQEAYGTHFDGFMRHYLTVKTGEIPRLNEVYEAFKTHARRRHVAGWRRGPRQGHSRLRPLFLRHGPGAETDTGAQAGLP